MQENPNDDWYERGHLNVGLTEAKDGRLNGTVVIAMMEMLMLSSNLNRSRVSLRASYSYSSLFEDLEKMDDIPDDEKDLEPSLWRALAEVRAGDWVLRKGDFWKAKALLCYWRANNIQVSERFIHRNEWVLENQTLLGWLIACHCPETVWLKCEERLKNITSITSHALANNILRDSRTREAFRRKIENPAYSVALIYSHHGYIDSSNQFRRKLGIICVLKVVWLLLTHTRSILNVIRYLGLLKSR
jgi:hypothetical protein